MLRLGVTLCLVGLGACASAPVEHKPLRVGFFDYRNGTHLELVSEAHTGRVEQYSAVVEADQAGRKVQTDEVMQGLVDLLHRRGFDQQAQPGPAPRSGDDRTMIALELEENGVVEHVLGYKGMPADQRTTLMALTQNFVDLFNQTYGLQAVDMKEGESPFENPVGPTRKKAPKVPDVPSGGGTGPQR